MWFISARTFPFFGWPAPHLAALLIPPLPPSLSPHLAGDAQKAAAACLEGKWGPCLGGLILKPYPSTVL